MNSNVNLLGLVEKLVQSENEQDRTKAEPLVAPHFTLITRARGVEQDRETLLDEIANSPNPNVCREVEKDDRWELIKGEMGVVRCVVRTMDRTDPQAGFK